LWTLISIHHTSYAQKYAGFVTQASHPIPEDGGLKWFFTEQRRYLEKQQRLACPGCGEEPFIG
jgi:hypothetical protein